MREFNGRLVIMAFAALALIASGGGFEAAEQDAEITYEIRPLVDLGGNGSRGNGINDSGYVTGFSNLPQGMGRRAVVWFNGQMFQLDPLGGTNTSVAWSGKNNSDLVVGITQTNELQTTRSRQPGRRTRLRCAPALRPPAVRSRRCGESRVLPVLVNPTAP